MKKQSTKQAARMRKYVPENNKFKQENEVCQIRVPEICTYFTSDSHHPKGRDGELLFGERIPCCRPCHDWVDQHPASAIAMGVSKKRLNK